MIREDFLAAVRELAERLGAELWRIVERQTAEARAAALEVAIGRLRSQIAAGAPDPEPATAPAERRRAPRRCSSCRSLEHDARRCHGSEPQDPPSSAQVAADEPPPAAPPAPVDDAPVADVADDTGTDDADARASSTPPLHEPTDSPASRRRPGRAARKEREVPSPRPTTGHRVLRPVDPRNNVPPPGWTPESDRREEHADLSILTTLRKCK